MSIKLIALDMDGTTLNSKGELSSFTKETIEKAINQGVEVIISTGRSFSALPKPVYTIEGLRYAVTSNGACIMDLNKGEAIYEDYISPKAINKVIEISKENNIWIEAFTGGKAYVGADFYDYVKQNGCTYRKADYVLSTRIPVDDIYTLMTDNIDKIENINFFFDSIETLEKYRDVIEAIPDAMITSSFPNNLEVGGPNTSKSTAIEALLNMKKLDKSELMCMGDAPNDIEMIKLAGIGVAMGNAWGQTKEYADYVTDTNDNDGVAKAIIKFVF